MGHQLRQPNTFFEVPHDRRIGQLRACFWKGKDSKTGDDLSYLAKFELYDDQYKLMWSCGKNEKKRNHWLETVIPRDQMIVGFRIIKCPGFKNIFGAGVVTASF